MARELGITSPLDEGAPAIGLGGLRVGVTPLEMAHAYATIANERRAHGRLRAVPRRGLADPGPDARPDHHRAHPHPRRDGRRQHADAAAAWCQRDERPRGHRRHERRAHRRHRRARLLRPPRRRQDGPRTSDYKDAWFAGFTPQRATAVWVGTRAPRASRWTRSSTAIRQRRHRTRPSPGSRFMNRCTQSCRSRTGRAAERLQPSRCSSTAATAPRGARRTGCRYARELVLAADKAPTQQSTCSRSLITRARHDRHDAARGAGATPTRARGVTIRFVRQPAARRASSRAPSWRRTPAPLEPIEIGGVVTATLAERVTTVIVPRVMSTSYDDVTVEQAITRLARGRLPRGGRRRRRRRPRAARHRHRPGPAAERAGRGRVDRDIAVTGAYTDGIEVPEVEGLSLTERQGAAGGGGPRRPRAARRRDAARRRRRLHRRPGPGLDRAARSTVVGLTTDSRSVASAAAPSGH